MSLQVDYSVEGSVLLVRISGFVNELRDHNEYLAALQAKLDQTGCDRILVDGRESRFSISTLDLFQIASADANAHHPKSLKRFAILSVPEEKADADFYENVTANRGFRVKFFLDEEQAWDYVRS